MRQPAPTLLAAMAGPRRVTLGLDSLSELRALSDGRELTCPGCGASVVLHAGSLLADHFAHLPGAICTLPATEPETAEHRAGKLLLASWLRSALPGAEVLVEAHLPETDQRADVLAVAHDPEGAAHRIALEFQCANLSAREWRRRRSLYASAGIEDLWILGASRLGSRAEGEAGAAPQAILRAGELERAIRDSGAPLLFLDAEGLLMPPGSLARHRAPAAERSERPGRFSCRPLLELAFPWSLLARARTDSQDSRSLEQVPVSRPAAGEPRGKSDWFAREWLAQRFHVTPEAMPAILGLELPANRLFSCDRRLWQGSLYYRFVYRQAGQAWWLPQVAVWAQQYLPLAPGVSLPRLTKALSGFQAVMAAAGLITETGGYNRLGARVVADLETLTSPPDPVEVEKLARYRQLRDRDDRRL